jgi:Nif-specific regulatory protein
MIAVPLQKKEKIIGVLEVLNKKNGVFDKSDLDLISTITPIMAMALDNARIYAKLEKAYQELQIKDKAKDSLIKNAEMQNIRLRKAIEKRYQFDQIIGNSDCMLDVYRLCEKVMDSDITILIEGETGTGKEVVARCIHFNSPRKDKPFVTQNCGGIPETLLTSELFGHKRGAFTGAFADKRGLFEIAHGGTIFLDEVAEMSPSMQTSLLRVLQEGEIKPLGANEFKKLDVRVISATHQDLEDRVKKGTFREDLFYRLYVFPIKLPPLRERGGDIPVLTRYFIDMFNKKYKRAVKGIDINAMTHLERYPFPGNVRELENEIGRAVAMAEDGKLIEPSHLSDKIAMNPKTAPAPVNIQGGLKEMVETLEKAVLSQMLETHHANKTRVAKALGLSRYGLIKKIQRYGL